MNEKAQAGLATYREKLTTNEIDKMVFATRDASAKNTVFGIGVNDVCFNVFLSVDSIWQHCLWRDMLKRCYDEKFKMTNPSYKDVICCDEWLYFGNFFEWVNKEVGYQGKPLGMQLDKDLIIKGNKVYSPEACSFVPRDVNALLTDRTNARGEWPVGVSKQKSNGRFIARLSCGDVKKSLGAYETTEQAFLAYKIAKEARIKEVALRYKEILKPAVFQSLMNWSVG